MPYSHYIWYEKTALQMYHKLRDLSSSLRWELTLWSFGLTPCSLVHGYHSYARLPPHLKRVANKTQQRESGQGNLRLVPKLSLFYLRNVLTGRSGDQIPVKQRVSSSVQTGPGAHPASCTMDTSSLSRKYSDRGVALTIHPHLAQRLKKE